MMHTHRQPLEALLAQLSAEPRFIRNVTAWQTIPQSAGLTSPWPEHIHPRLVQTGQVQGIQRLYTHQHDAALAVSGGDNVVLSTGTASGKSIGYMLPLLDSMLRDPTATALLLFPTKALAHDQLAVLQRWVDTLGVPIAVRPYDGDTPQSHRSDIRQQARLLISNPDMLHLGILPHHTQWMRFFQGLRFVVLDELHTYRGIFGSHIANVLRRLRRIAAFYGAAPRCIAASATIANPQQLAESLWESPFTSIELDGAPYGHRHIVFYNPPLVNPALGLRASAFDEALDLTERLLDAGVQTIIFARSRLSVELFLQSLRARVVTLGYAPEAVQGYRGGYLPHERRAIERGLRDGKVRAVVATNALELGIDIGALDASILLGYPGTIASTRQQMGRAGRRAGTSLSVLVATPAPLDQYVITHPEYFFERSPEEARVDPDTLSIIASHLSCAAFELPFGPGESFGNARDTQSLLDALAGEGVLHSQLGRFTWIGESYPAQAVSLRSATPDNVVIQVEGLGIIGTVDRLSAPVLVHEGAVYFHGGEPYLVDRLDWERGIAFARSMKLDYYTVAAAATRVESLAVRKRIPESIESADFMLADEEVLVHIKPTMYRRVHLTTRETLGWGDIQLPEQEMETEAFRLVLGERLVDALADLGIWVAPLDYGPDWPKIREEILARDQHRCRLCGATAETARVLEVHHLTPLRTFLSQNARSMALRQANAPDNLLTLCPVCHRKVEQARGARTALGGLAYLIRNLAPVFLMCDPGDLGTTIEPADPATGQPAVVVYDAVPGGVGLSPRLVLLWPTLAAACLERVTRCPCADGCPSCVGPTGENEPGAKGAARQLLELMLDVHPSGSRVTL